MIERLICFALVLPAFIFCAFEFDNKKAGNVLRIVGGAGLFLLAMYLGAILP